MSSSVEAGRQAALTWPVILMILASVCSSAVAQVSLRHGMSIPAVQAGIAAGGAWPVALAIAGSPTVLLGLALYAGSMVFWLFVLASLEVSVAYAFVALGFLLTMSLGCLVLGEPLTLRKLGGTAFVMAGIWLVATGR
jgi:multidrug transporter EmrE-like cation transporter